MHVLIWANFCCPHHARILVLQFHATMFTYFIAYNLSTTCTAFSKFRGALSRVLFFWSPLVHTHVKRQEDPGAADVVAIKTSKRVSSATTKINDDTDKPGVQINDEHVHATRNAKTNIASEVWFIGKSQPCVTHEFHYATRFNDRRGTLIMSMYRVEIIALSHQMTKTNARCRKFLW